jgi:hypothetical protein
MGSDARGRNHTFVLTCDTATVVDTSLHAPDRLLAHEKAMDARNPKTDAATVAMRMVVNTFR